MMETIKSPARDGARPLEIRRGGRVPGPKPRRGPPSATGGPLPLSCSGRRQGQREITTGQDKIKNLNIIHWNANGIYSEDRKHSKKIPLENRLKQEEVEIACIQETYLKEGQRFSVRGYQVFRHDRKDRKKGGVAILVKNSIPAQDFIINTNGETEIHGVNIKIKDEQMKIYNVYSPPDKDLSLYNMAIQEEKCLVVGDFNSHSEMWENKEADKRGEEVEDWQIDNKLTLLNDPDDPPTFYSKQHFTTSTIDLAFATNDIAKISTRIVLDQLAGSDHRPVKLNLDLQYKVEDIDTFSRWNYRKARWEKFSELVDQYTKEINNRRQNINTKIKALNNAILKAAYKTIPRGCRKNYKPYWTEELKKQEDEVQKARELAETNPSEENNIRLKAATAKHKRTLIQETRRSWQEKTANLNLDKDGKKLWNLVRALNDENPKGRPIVLEQDGKLFSNKQATDILINHYNEISSLQINKDDQKEMKQKNRMEPELPMDMMMNSAFKMEELEIALKGLLLRKSPGPDDITNEMLLHLGPHSKKKMLQLFNDSWRTGNVPQIWREAIMIPILKTGKDRTKAESYRPISLTSCIGKLMERLINTRLMWYLESKQYLPPEQAAFRQNRSTEDQITYISQAIEDAFQEKKQTLAIWIDLEKAFDKVWKEGLKHKMRQCGIGGQMYEWISQYLSNRKARVQIKKHSSRKLTLQEGVPQGGVLSPTLFLIFIRDIVHQLPKNVKGALYADDLALWCSEEYTSTANYRLRQVLEKIEDWAHTWHIKINERKTTFTVFSLSTQPQKVKLTLKGKDLQEEESPTYLGITLDRRLTWNKQLQKKQVRAKIRLALMKKLAGTQWGADQAVLKRLYTGRIRPVLEYGNAASSTAAKSNKQKLSRIQNQAMRMMTGAMKSTPIHAMETITGLQNLDDRCNTKVLIQAAKFKRLQDHPMHERTKSRNKGRLKRSSFHQESRELEQKSAELLDHPLKLIETAKSTLPWTQTKPATICCEVPDITSKDYQTDIERKCLTLEYINCKYPEEQWTHIYTDGSATNAVQNGGGGVYMRLKDGEKEISLATGKYSTNYRAEATAIERAIEEIRGNPDNSKQKVVIFTDALSVLKSLQSPKPKDLDSLLSTLKDTIDLKDVTLQWIPAHCGLHGNEKADTLAKEGSLLDQPDNQVTYEERKTIIKGFFRKKWIEEHPNYDKKDAYHRLNRADQVVIFRLRTGHNRLNAHMNRKLKIAETAMCPCNDDIMDANHILQNCRLYNRNRQETWTEPSTLKSKLYGTLKELQRTASFLRAIGVSI